ncbi:MAG: hypothetical protein PVF54_05495 [Anaerolineae bacterium]
MQSVIRVFFNTLRGEGLEKRRLEAQWARFGDPDEGENTMAEKRFNDLGTASFLGDYLYEQTVLELHFLRQPEELVHPDLFARKLARLPRDRAKPGCPPYDPVVILKVLLWS